METQLKSETTEQPDQNHADSSAETAEEICKSVETFLLQLDALQETVNRVMPILLLNEKKSKEAFLAVIGKLEAADPESSSFDRDAFDSDFAEFERQKRARIKATEARRMVPQSILVSMVSQYDAYLSNIARKLFLLRPEKVRAAEKSIPITQLVKYSTIEEALQQIVDEEVDEILRASHLEQLEWIAKRFDFKIDANQSIVQEFVEVTERRNICVHADGRISRYYLDRCKGLEKKYVADGEIGKWVPIGAKYLRSARNVLFEVGLRIVQAAWRKARPDQSDEQGLLLVDILFDLLKLEDFSLAKRIGTFCLELRDLSDSDRRILAINLAIAHKLTGDKKTAHSIIDKMDWTASENRLVLGVETLRENYEAVGALMQNIPTRGRGSVSAEEYRTWPLFKEARDQPMFKEAFQLKFGEPIEKRSSKEATDAVARAKSDVEAEGDTQSRLISQPSLASATS